MARQDQLKNSEESQEETPEQKNARFARGEISDAEITDYLRQPQDVLFEHTLNAEKKGKEPFDIKVRALTRELMDQTLENMEGSWDKESFDDLRGELTSYFEQKERGIPEIVNNEYYIATDREGNPLGMTGVYSIDIEGGAGLTTKDSLDLSRHNLNMYLGWYSVTKKAQGTGLGKYLLEWTEKMAGSRGAVNFAIETDDWEVSEKAVKMYKKSGYKEGFPVKDFYGPGRDLDVYYCDTSKEEKIPSVKISEITEENKRQILELARNNYSPERFEEFRVCLDLFLLQSQGSSIYKGHSVVAENEKGLPESFAIYAKGVYDNCMPVYWTAADKDNPAAQKKLLDALKAVSKFIQMDMIMMNSEGEDKGMEDNGFTKAKHGIPKVFGEDDSTNLLLFTKPSSSIY